MAFGLGDVMARSDVRNDVYFASYAQGDPTYLEALLDKVSIYRNYIRDTGKEARWKLAHKNYFGSSSDGQRSSHRVTRGGDEGEFTFAKVSDYRNLIQHQLILITSQRPAGKGKATNSDPAALKQAKIGSQLIEHYLSQVGFEQKFVRICEYGQVCDEGFATIDWDANTGDVIRPKADEMGNLTGEMEMTGDMVMRAIAPWNMARDPYMDGPDAMKWGIYSYRVNKWDLAAKYPAQRDAIIKGGDMRSLKELAFNELPDKNTDQIEVHCLSHDKTPACPDGRYTIFIPDAVLLDSAFPYPEFNIYRESQNDEFESPFGYTNNNDLLALEEVTDSLYGIVISNNTTFGGQLIIATKGQNLDYQQLGKGMTLMEVENIAAIKSEQFTKSAPETYSLLETLSRKKETLAGINSVVRGDPEGALKGNSGSAMALVQAQSIQFNSGGQRSFYHILSRTCTGMIKMLHRFAHTERVIRITGQVQGQYLEEVKYSGKDLEDISAVTFEITNPLEQTIGAKDARAQDLLKAGMITDPRQYLMVARTGNLDTIIEDDEAFAMAIKSENQILREGGEVQPIVTENHEKHIQGHSAVIASPEAKDDPDLVKEVLEHIDAHLQMWKMLSTDNPALLVASHQQVLPPDPPAPGMLPPGITPMGAPPPGPMQGPDVMNAQSPAQAQAARIRPPNMPNMPNMPKNPLTGDRAPGPMVS